MKRFLSILIVFFLNLIIYFYSHAVSFADPCGNLGGTCTSVATCTSNCNSCTGSVGFNSLNGYESVKLCSGTQVCCDAGPMSYTCTVPDSSVYPYAPDSCAQSYPTTYTCNLTSYPNTACTQTCSGICYSATACPNGTSNLGGGCNYGALVSSVCCSKPDCNTGISCNNCSTPTNTCSTGNETCTGCTYNSYTGGGSCTVVAAPNQNYTNPNCSNGYTCVSGTCDLTYCTTGTTNCGTCGGGSEPANTCNLNGTNAGTQTCHHNGPAGCVNQTAFQNACTYSYNNCAGAYTCTNNNSCQTHIAGTLYKDYNHDGNRDSGEVGFSGITVHLNNGDVTTTNANGQYFFYGITQGTYSVWYDLPAGYQASTTSPQTVTLTSSSSQIPDNIDFGVTPLYTLTGRVYDDVNKNRLYDSGVDTGENGDTVTIVGLGGAYNKTFTANGSVGSFTTGQTLLSGAYTVTYNGPPTGWKIMYPGPPAVMYNVQVGLPGSSTSGYVCDTKNYHNVSCDASGSLSEVDFGISNENSFITGVCTDMRIDGQLTNNGTTSTGFVDPLPNPPSSNVFCGGNSSNQINASSYALDTGTVTITNSGGSGGGSLTCPKPGVVFSGTATPDFGNGQASKDPYNWSTGGTSPYTESFSPINPTIIRTSYSYLTTTAQQSGIDLTTAAHNLSSFCGAGGLNNCTLSGTLPDNVYLANGDLHLNAYTFPTGKNYVILVNGDMYIQGEIHVPVGSTAVFSTSGNIYVNSSVGTTPTDTTANIEGLFSADKSFIINSDYTLGSACNDDGTPKDLRLNVQGSVIVNAAQTGGSFVNQRDLCASDLSCPAYQISQRLDFLLNAPDFVKHKNFVWQEQAP